MDAIPSSRNRLLLAMSKPDWLLLEPHLQFVDLPLKTTLEPPNAPIDACYFLSEGVASVVATGIKGEKIEVGLIGREGVTGSAAILGDTQSPHAVFMQIAGRGHQITILDLKKAMQNSDSLSAILTKFVHSFMIQKSQTALVNGKGKLGPRLARWLLMAHDRVEAPGFL
jgi:CRP-like cAMP-binding protein